MNAQDPVTVPPAESSRPAAPRGPGVWSARVETAAGSTYEWLTRPRVRLAVLGAGLLLLGGLIMTSSVWTLPLVIVGVVMVVMAWVGHRLDGRFVIEWGDSGTQVMFRATIKPPSHRTPALPSPSLAAAEVIEGEAHTVEIDVAELKALIAQAEQAEGGDSVAPEGDAEIRVHRIHPHQTEAGKTTH